MPTVRIMIFDQLIDLYSLVIIGAVVVSWIEVPRDNPAVKFLHSATEPLLGPIRRALPTTGGIDFSPIVLLIGLQLLGRIF